MKKIIASIINNLRTVYGIIPGRLKKQYVKIILLSFVLALVEFIGLSVLIPFFNEITETGGRTYLQLVNNILPTPLNIGQNQSIIFSIAAVVVLLLIKNSISVFVVFKQFKFGSIVQASVSEGLFSGYLKKQYNQIVDTNSSELIRNAIPETNKLNESVIVPSFFLITDSFLVATIITFLLITEPLASAILFSIIGVFYGLPVYYFGQKLTEWGKERFSVEGKRMKILQEGLGAFVEIKLRNAAEQYIRKYKKVNTLSANYGYLLNANLQIPKFALEIFIFLALLTIIVVTSLFPDYSNKDLLRVLGIFAISAYKLIPTLGRITNTIQTIRFYKPSMEVFAGVGEGDSGATTIEHKRPLAFSKQLQIQNLNLNYGSNTLLKDINLTIHKGDAIGIIGESGSGKTSLAYCILGLTDLTSGEILVDGVNIQSNLNGWRGMIGYVPQAVYLLDDSIQENIALNFSGETVDQTRLLLVTKQAGLSTWVESLPQGFNTYVGERGNQISGGQMQRIGIARALYRNPEILVFDESTSALDSGTEREFLETIETLKRDKTILFITHKRAPLTICDEILKIEKGTIHIQNTNSPI